MSTTYHYDEMLSTLINGELSATDKRQVEVYDQDNKLYLRIGNINIKNTSDAPHEVLLTEEDAEGIMSALKSGIQRCSLR